MDARRFDACFGDIPYDTKTMPAKASNIAQRGHSNYRNLPQQRGNYGDRVSRILDTSTLHALGQKTGLDIGEKTVGLSLSLP